MSILGCGGASKGVPSAATSASSALQNGPAAIPRGTRSFTTGALIYNGDGAWGTEVASIESILTSNNTTYQEVNSAQLNAMTAAQIAQFGTIVWPGGEAGTQAASLTNTTKANLRQAVQILGVSWVGFCAGSFIAVEPASTVNSSPDYGLEIVDGSILSLYYLDAQDVAAGITDINMTMETFADGTQRDLIWYGGPVTPAGPNIVVAKYPTGEPAISQMWSGNGLVILSGVHPAAPQAVRDAFGLTDVDGTDFDLAWKIFNAAIKQQDLTTFAN